MLTQKRPFSLGKHDGGWTVNIEKWWRKAAGYSRLNGSSSPSPGRRNSEIQMKTIDNERPAVPKIKLSQRRPSTARPVVIVERTREAPPPVKRNRNRPVLNINEEFIEVFYWTQSRYNYPGQLERYTKNLCYCCADCPACQVEAQCPPRDRHRPLSQVLDQGDTSYETLDDRWSYSSACNGNILRTSYA